MVAKVELRPAWTWTCEECGRDNFCRCTVGEFDDEMKKEIGDLTDEELAMGEFVTQPIHVECKHCQTMFETECCDEDKEGFEE